MNRHLASLLGVLWVVVALSPVRAEVFYATGDPAHNSTAPGGAYANSGWDLEGNHRGYMATPIAPNYFIAAKHPYGPNLGFTINFASGPNAGSYTTIAAYDDPSADLRIFQISGTFAAWAPLYTGSEVGQELVAFGNGVNRGAEEKGFSGTTLRGWRWGSDSRQRWGTNIVTALANDPLYGNNKLFTFDFNSVPALSTTEEMMLADGDSSAGVFIKDVDNVWKLAGLALGVDGRFSDFADGSGSFLGAIFDARDLYVGPPYVYIDPNPGVNPDPIPTASYATRISAQYSWIAGIVPSVIPEPSSLTLLWLAGLLAHHRRRRQG